MPLSCPSLFSADLSKPRPHSDDYSTMKKIPPPKPKRSPNTKLTGSYEEIPGAPLQRPTDMKLACLARAGHHHHHGLGTIQRTASMDGPHSAAALSLYRCPDDEDVYIEMVGTSQALGGQPETDSPEMGEAVYEEMKYFLPEEGGSVVASAAGPVAQPLAVRPETLEPLVHALDAKRASGAGCGVGSAEQVAKQGAKDGASCDIPAPFPNLLPHRPPLLVFPPSPVTCSPASDESPLTPLEVKKLPVFETNLNFSQDGSSPLSPQYARQRADSSPSLSVLMPDRSTPPLTPPPAPAPPIGTILPPAPPPPPYRPPSHFPFPPEPCFMSMTRGHSGSVDTSCSTTPPPMSAGVGLGGGGKPPYSPVKGGPSARPEPRRAHSCSSSPLLFNPANGRPLTSPLDELNTLFSSGRHLLRKSSTRRKVRDAGKQMREGGWRRVRGRCGLWMYSMCDIMSGHF